MVTIAATDKAFETKSCGTWTAKLEPVTDGAALGEGKFIVGLDIQPGTYASSGNEGCYWARLSGFGGTLDEIITNEYADG